MMMLRLFESDIDDVQPLIDLADAIKRHEANAIFNAAGGKRETLDYLFAIANGLTGSSERKRCYAVFVLSCFTMEFPNENYPEVLRSTFLLGACDLLSNPNPELMKVSLLALENLIRSVPSFENALIQSKGSNLVAAKLYHALANGMDEEMKRLSSSIIYILSSTDPAFVSAVLAHGDPAALAISLVDLLKSTNDNTRKHALCFVSMCANTDVTFKDAMASHVAILLELMSVNEAKDEYTNFALSVISSLLTSNTFVEALHEYDPDFPSKLCTILSNPDAWYEARSVAIKIICGMMRHKDHSHGYIDTISSTGLGEKLSNTLDCSKYSSPVVDIATTAIGAFSIFVPSFANTMSSIDPKLLQKLWNILEFHQSKEDAVKSAAMTLSYLIKLVPNLHFSFVNSDPMFFTKFCGYLKSDNPRVTPSLLNLLLHLAEKNPEFSEALISSSEFDIAEILVGFLHPLSNRRKRLSLLVITALAHHCEPFKEKMLPHASTVSKVISASSPVSRHTGPTLKALCSLMNRDFAQQLHNGDADLAVKLCALLATPLDQPNNNNSSFQVDASYIILCCILFHVEGFSNAIMAPELRLVENLCEMLGENQDDVIKQAGLATMGVAVEYIPQFAAAAVAKDDALIAKLSSLLQHSPDEMMRQSALRVLESLVVNVPSMVTKLQRKDSNVFVQKNQQMATPSVPSRMMCSSRPKFVTSNNNNNNNNNVKMGTFHRCISTPVICRRSISNQTLQIIRSTSKIIAKLKH